MVRTADNSSRVAGGKSTRKGGNVSARQESSRSRSPNSSGDRGGGLNSVCPRETPSWQKPITTFFTVLNKSDDDDKEVQNKPGSSKNVTDDVNMIEVDKEGTNQNDPQCSYENKQSIEAMDEEFHEIKIDKTENNKENKTSIANVLNTEKTSAGTEMEEQELNRNTKKKIKARDDSDEEMAPPKRIKLDKNIYKHLQELEQS